MKKNYTLVLRSKVTNQLVTMNFNNYTFDEIIRLWKSTMRREFIIIELKLTPEYLLSARSFEDKVDEILDAYDTK